MASLPIKLRQNYTPVNSPIADLLEYSPNPNMTSFDFIRTMEVCRMTDGSSYELKVYDDLLQVTALLPLEPSRVQPVIEHKTRELWHRFDGDNGSSFFQ